MSDISGKLDVFKTYFNDLPYVQVVCFHKHPILQYLVFRYIYTVPPDRQQNKVGLILS